MSWEINSYVGLNEIKFECSIDDIIQILGKPVRDKTTPTGRRRLQFSERKPAIVFEKENIVEISLLPQIDGGATYHGECIFSQEPDLLLRFLQNCNGQIYERNGFLILFKLGFVLTGFHDDDSNQKSLVMFRRNFYWNALRNDMAPINF
ncbi:hypothetical protein [Methylobacterium sp. Leaf469]|uniref:hypothetical protein n=1 Tax=Methylobacterium sp. Leaf469 TaxID=1736387 RepID=UPI000A4BCE8E|nr:hypothetical protein [Methylobacterium sp. Leaf469]